ncbi:MAG: acetoacetate decarboxylase family protein [Byssovorax sp.]
MNLLDPYGSVSLDGDAILRGVTLALPSDTVRGMLPYGLDLGDQRLTPPGTHPVVLWFQIMLRAHMSVPTLLPSMTYLEHIFGVPFVYVTRGAIDRRTPGPAFFMARLYLDSLLATAGGVLWWGFAKQMAEMRLTARRFSVAQEGEPLISLDFEPRGPFRSLASFPRMAPIREIMRQPLVSQVPAAVGPFFAFSDFHRDVEGGEIRPLATVVQIDEQFLPGLPCGRFPAEMQAPGIDTSALGSYEIRSPWRQGLIYPPRPRPPSRRGRART